MRPFSPHTVILVVANPVDLLTTLAQDIAGLPRKQVIGTGTCLDSLRLRGEVSRILGTKMEETEGYVIGVQGNESQVVMCPGLLYPYGGDENSIQKKMEVESKIQRKSKAIIAGKGGAPWGIGAVAGSVAAAMVGDDRRVWTVSCWRENWKCCCSWPVVVGREGVVEEVGLDLSTGEREAVELGVKSLNVIVERVKENEA